MQKPKDTISKGDAKEVLITPVKENKGNKAVGKENESVHTSKRKSERIASRPKSNLTMQEQATRLLMKNAELWTPTRIWKRASRKNSDHSLLSL